MERDAREWILVFGAREHNLKNISTALPKGKFTVITGPSGSGKSSLAFDVLYAEGQRRYLESLSLYARQFLGMPQKAQCDRIEGLCPAIAIDQKTVGSNPRSTVGTITEVYDYLRVLYARIGHLHCPQCRVPVESSTVERMVHQVGEKNVGLSVLVCAPIAREKKGTFVNELSQLIEQGFHRFLIDEKRYSFDSVRDLSSLNLAKTKHHSVEVIVDHLEVLPLDPDERQRLAEALERACALAHGFCLVRAGMSEQLFSMARTCLQCDRSFSELEPRMFSFNSPIGACKQCHGLGVVFAGSEWLGVETTCSRCWGRRLHDEALSVFINEHSIYDLGELSIKKLRSFFEKIDISPSEYEIARGLIHEINHRLSFLEDVGLGYLTLNRDARSLSGGEGQRIRLARQLGSSLSGVLYLLDEPSIGLHQRDNDRLIETLKKLRDIGNTVVVVEHDIDTMMQADYLIDMGPAAGVFGGSVVAEGTPVKVAEDVRSVTGAYLSGRRSVERISPLRVPRGFATLTRATAHNLKNLTVKFPLGVFCGVSGVSGSGKSSLIMHELVPALQALTTKHGRTRGTGVVDIADQTIASVVVIDQSPIGRTPRSNPATYIGIFNDIRALFAGLPESKVRGYPVGRFSFNVAGGRCETCRGDGTITIAMHFLPDVVVDCKACGGKRFNKETLEITYKGKNIADILAMSVNEAAPFFSAHKSIARRLQLLADVGLGYLTLGQPATTLSGGEAQRIKLVNELAKRGEKTFYILDEPTTGLHSCDIEKLLIVFDRLVEKGNSVLVIEHNLDVLKAVDYLIDLGPEGGDEGGTVVASGTPEQVAQSPMSHTGSYLRRILRV
ncbi:MAG: excinuclease ABC subunit UvrA [Candidatus Babeliaceae bacterium]|nr:excinuclease ABC subunit UvrA [Candidatus Babeliaceae bacterium]